MKCAQCQRRVVELTVKAARRYTLWSCSGCDRRVWVVDGAAASLEDVTRELRTQKAWQQSA